MIKASLHEHTFRLTFSRPEKKNALTSEMYRALTEHLLRAESDPAVRAVIFDAEGDAFCAGNDLNEFAAVAAGGAQPQEVRAFLYALASATKPYLAAVQGKAVGIGATLLLHCDVVFLAQNAQLSTPFVNLGLVPEAASSLLLPARIGHVQAFEMFALGQAIDATKALALGIANAIVPADQLHARVIATAGALSTRPIGALQATKKLMRDARRLHSVMDQEIEVFAERLKSAEALAALKAFAKRRDGGV